MPNKAGGPTEKEWQRTLVEAMQTCGWTVSHTYPLRTQFGWRTGCTLKGWPDLVGMRGPYIIAIEVKTDTGRLDPDQIDVLTKFSLVAGARTWVLRPRDDLREVWRWLTHPQDAPRVHGWVRPKRT